MSIRTAIIGLGTVAQWHRRALRRTPQTDLIAVADTDPDRARRISMDWGVVGYTDVETLLKEETIDWVHVCTPARTHCEISIRCLAAGADVLVEKPFVMDMKQFNRVDSVMNESDNRVTAVHNQAYYDPIKRACRRIRAGEFGTVHGVSVLWGERIDPNDSDRGEWVLELPGGEFGEGIVHPIYIGLRFAGYPTNSEDVAVHRINTTNTDTGYDGIAVSFNSAKGTTCSIQHHSNVPDQRRIDIITEDAHITVDVATQSVTVQHHSFGPNTSFNQPLLRAALDTTRRALRTVTDATRQWVQTAVSEESIHDTHTPVIRREAQAIRGHGKGPTPMPEARWTTHILSDINDIS